MSFDASLWHESVEAAGQQLLLVGYTPRSLHKLAVEDRALLWNTGFTLVHARTSTGGTILIRRC